MATEAVRGVLLDHADAKLLVEVLRYLDEAAAKNGRRPTPQVEALRRRLESAFARVSSPTTRDTANASGRQPSTLVRSGHVELIDTRQAARLLGITPDGIRHHARRGTLPAQRLGGRWLLDATAVADLAEQRHRAG